MPLNVLEWAPVLTGSDFSFYLERAAAAVAHLSERHGPVALVGHSAGGWLARILLGDVPYQGA
jgi:alpha-beta hydrolase superfamily lysophospholipase